MRTPSGVERRPEISRFLCARKDAFSCALHVPVSSLKSDCLSDRWSSGLDMEMLLYLICGAVIYGVLAAHIDRKVEREFSSRQNPAGRLRLEEPFDCRPVFRRPYPRLHRHGRHGADSVGRLTNRRPARPRSLPPGATA